MYTNQITTMFTNQIWWRSWVFQYLDKCQGGILNTTWKKLTFSECSPSSQCILLEAIDRMKARKHPRDSLPAPEGFKQCECAVIIVSTLTMRDFQVHPLLLEHLDFYLCPLALHVVLLHKWIETHQIQEMPNICKIVIKETVTKSITVAKDCRDWTLLLLRIDLRVSSRNSSHWKPCSSSLSSSESSKFGSLPHMYAALPVASQTPSEAFPQRLACLLCLQGSIDFLLSNMCHRHT